MEKLATSAVDGALNVAKSAVVTEVALQLGVRRDLEFITSEFEIMQTFLVTSNEEHSKDPVARVWGRQARDVAYDVEDYIEDFAIHLGGKSWWWFSPGKVLKRHQIATKMKNLRARVQDLSNRRTLYYGPVVRPAPAEPALTAGPDRSRPSGKDLKRPSGVDLTKLLNRRDNSLMIVSVCVGTTMKTTLIGKAYDELALTGQFRVRAWVKVMHPFNLTELIRSLLRQFKANASSQEGALPPVNAQNRLETMGAQELVDSLSELLIHQRYMLVLDDISTREEWDSIKLYLGTDANNTNRIIVTSQKEDVARYCTGGLMSTSFRVSDGSEFFPAFCNTDILADEPAQLTSSAGNPGNIASTGREIIEVGYRSTASASVADGPQLVGREKEMDWLISNLTRDAGTENNNVLSVCGLRGIGKTALVLNAYHHQDVIGYFICRAWITISSPLDEDGLLQSVLQQFKSDFCTPYIPRRSLQEMRSELVEFYKMMNRRNPTAKCLLVVDGVSRTTEWDFLVNSCSISEEYKTMLRVVIITRELQAASYCCNNNDNFVYSLNRLHEVDATKLFHSKVFRQYNNVVLSQDLVEQQNHILEKCGGIPFAIINIGLHLASRDPTVREWERAHKNLDLQHLEGRQYLGPMRTTMESCYDSLSYHVKYCFMYLSIFQEDVNITRRRLVKRWIAEGYMKGMQGAEAEEFGERVFNELLSMTIMQPTRYAGITGGRVTSCSVHPLMLQLSTSKAKEEKLVCILDDLNRDMVSGDTIRHVVVRRSWRRDDHKDKYVRMNMSSVRSLTIFGEWRPFFLSRKMQMLRVLDLEGVEGLTGHDLRHIGKFRHLKYLGLRNTHVEHMPKSLGKLQYLETLDFKYTKVRTLPSTIGNLKRLRVLRGGSRSLQAVHDIISEPEGGDPWGVDVPKEIGKLGDLNTLGTVSIRKQNRLVIPELRRLTELQKLSVTGITDEDGPDLCSTLHCLSRLQSLALHSPASAAGLSESNCSKNGLSESLRFPLANLQVLKIHGHLPVLPPWISGLRNLFKLYLHNTRTTMDEASICLDLGGLPNLTTLLLLADSIVATRLKFESHGFQELELLVISHVAHLCLISFRVCTMPKLRTLDVSGCSDLKGLSVQEGSMPKLERLSVEGCDSLRSLPFGRDGTRRRMPMLRSFQVGGCDNLGSLRFVQGDTPNLEILILRRCKNLSLRSEAEAMPRLKMLQISNCQNLQLLPRGVPMRDGQEISSKQLIEEEVMPNLETLKIEGCHELQGLIFESGAMPMLDTLLMKDCRELNGVVFRPGAVGKLETLEIEGCHELQGLIFESGAMPMLDTLLMKDCRELNEVVFRPGAVGKLETLEIRGCPRLVESTVVQCLNARNVSYDDSSDEEINWEN